MQTQNQQTVNLNQFQFEIISCAYSNTEKLKVSNQWAKTVLISNYLAKKQNDSLIKITEVRFQDRILIIQDKFSFSFLKNGESTISDNIKFLQKTSNLRKKEELIQQQKKQSFSQNSYQFQNSHLNFSQKCEQEKKIQGRQKKKHINFFSKYDQKTRLKRNTKNVARNIIRKFMKFIQKKNDRQYDKVSQLCNKIGFNNSLVLTIIRDIRLKCLFKNFLEGPVFSWLHNGKAIDKQSHIQAINVYLNIINNQKSQTHEC